MLFADRESNIIELFRELETEEIGLIPDDIDTMNICRCLMDSNHWENWVDSSGKNMPPPDYYNIQEGLMMEVMRVDDHAFQGNKRIINPTLARERKIERELRESGFLSQFPDSMKIIINADSGLHTNEDHNYQFYFENFKRTIEHHKSKINNYQRNHPGFKTIFFVFDESTAYVLMKKVPKEIKQGQLAKGEAHLWFADKRFIEVFQNSSIDFLIWFSPYKLIQSIGKPPFLPTACVFDCNRIDFDLIDYDISHMVSAEV